MKDDKFDIRLIVLPLWLMLIPILLTTGWLISYEPVDVVYPVVEEVAIPERLPDLDLDLGTMCQSANQFGLNMNTMLYFGDKHLVMKDHSIQWDNNLRRGHVVALLPSHNVDVWFDEVQSCYTAFTGYNDDGDDYIVDWTVHNLSSEDVFAAHITNLIDYASVLAALDGAVNIVEQSDSVVYEDSKGIWYLSKIPVDSITSSILADPDSVTCRVFKPHDPDNIITQVDFVIDYPENDSGVTREIREYEIELVDHYSCEIPPIVMDASDDYDTLLVAYENTMR